jgi:PAS domain S-box-containing protein
MAPSRKKAAFLSQITGTQLVGLFDLLPDVSFFVKDRKGRFVAMNPRGCEYCGVKSERDALGKSDYDFFPKRRAAEYVRDDKLVLETGRPIVNRVESAPEHEGSPHMVLTCKVPLFDQKGRVVGIAGFSRRSEELQERPEGVTRFAEVIRHMHDHVHEHPSSRELARLAGLSLSQFDRTFQRLIGSSPTHYMQRICMEVACRHLAEGSDTIATIAQVFGFYDHAHFTRCFRKIMGLTPSAYRRKHQMPLPGADATRQRN